MNIINLTPHAVDVVRSDGSIKTYPSSGQVARLDVSRKFVRILDGAEVHRPSLGGVTGLPEAQMDVTLIVSALVAQACPDRSDLVSPGELVRDSAGKIIGCKGFAFYGLA